MTSTTTTTTESQGQYLHEAKSLQLEVRPLAPLADDEVRVAIRATTVCGSDVHYYTHFCNGSIRVREALCLGHEAAGEVTALGAGVAATQPDLRVGDAVALECGVPCGDCAHCRGGRYNVCPRLRFRSSGSAFPHFQGTLQERVDHPARWLHRLPAELGFEEGALLEPLAVAIHAVGRERPDTVAVDRPACLIFGAGAVGLLCAVAARAQGCHDVVIVDIDEGRLAFAREHGFASTVLAVKPRRGDDLQAKLDIARETAIEIAALTWPDGTPVGRLQRTYECTGAESCLQSSIYVSVDLCCGEDS